MSTETIEPQQYRQLFLDDGAIESMEALHRVLHQPVDTTHVITPDRSRGECAVQSGSVPQWNPQKSLWEWWYKGFTTYTDEYLTLYATSADGVHWEKADVGLYEWNGTRSNNVAFVADKSNLCHVIRDDVDPDPQRRYKGLFSDEEHMDRYPGVSADGFQWQISDGPPIPSHDTSTLVYDDVAQRYLAIVKHRTEWGRSAFLSTSADFDHWSDPELVLHTDEIDRKNRKRRIQAGVDDPDYLSPPVVDGQEYLAQLYMMPVLPYEGLYVGFPLLFNPSGADGSQNNHTGLNQVELAVARDARAWERVADRAIFVGIHDSGCLSVNSPETPSRRSPPHMTMLLRGISALLVIAGCRGDDVGSAIDDLSNPNSKVRLRASHELIRHDSAAVEPLIDRATTGSDSLRYISAQILGRIGDRRALPALKRLAEDSNEHVRRAALVGLGSMGDSGVFDYLVAILSEDALPALRAAAAEGLAAMGDTLAVPALVHALADTSSSVRKQAVVALHRLWTQRAEAAIARVVIEDPDEVVRFVAAQSLGQHGAVSAGDPLRTALRDSSVWVRAEAARSLGTLGDTAAIEDLGLLLERGEEGPDYDAAREALQMLTHDNDEVADSGE